MVKVGDSVEAAIPKVAQSASTPTSQRLPRMATKLVEVRTPPRDALWVTVKDAVASSVHRAPCSPP
jgi:hypothetical protein